MAMNSDTAGSNEEPGKHEYRRVLIAVDGSEHSKRAFQWYVNNLHRSNDEIFFCTAFQPPVLPMTSAATGVIPVTEWEPIIQTKMTEVENIESAFLELAKGAGLSCTFEVIQSNKPGEAIVQAANTLDASFVVMGSRGLGQFRRTFMGSVSDYVLHHIALPVTVVPPEQ